MSRHLTLLPPPDSRDTDPTDVGVTRELAMARVPEPRPLSRPEQAARSLELQLSMGWTPLSERYGDRIDQPCSCGAAVGQPCLGPRRPGRRRTALPRPHGGRGATQSEQPVSD